MPIYFYKFLFSSAGFFDTIAWGDNSCNNERKVFKRKVFKIVDGGPLGLFKNPVCFKISKQLIRDSLEALKKFSKKVSQSQKMKKVSKCRKKLEMGDPSALERFRVSC